MRAINKINTQTKMSFIEVHRRKQILDIAIQIIAREGYQKTTLASVAKEAGFTKGVIFYYFKNKDELVEQINTVLLDELREYTKSRMKSKISESRKLKTYLEAYFDFIKENKEKFMILTELGINLNYRQKDPIFGQQVYIECRRKLDKLLELDKDCCNYSRLKTNTLSTIIQGALDGIGIQWLSDPEFVDLDDCRRVLTEMIDTHIKSARQDG